jgi:hypothetical protein
MDVKTSFFDMSEVQKDSEEVGAGIGIFFIYNPIYKNFVQNLMSKLARSTLTLHGTIRVKLLVLNR